MELLEDRTIGELLDIPGFGPKSLVDLLTSVESFISKVKLGKSKAAAKETLFTKQDESLVPRANSGPQLKSEYVHRLISESRKLQGVRYARTIHRHDPRLGHLLRAIDPDARTVQDIADHLISHAQNLPNSDALCAKLGELREKIRVLSQTTFLEDELSQLAIAIEGKRNAQIFAYYYGWDGRGGSTLRAVANKFGISPERVRQICERMAEALKGNKAFAPVLDQVLEFIAEHIPGIADEIESEMALKILTMRSFRLEGVRHAAKLLDREISFNIATVDGKRVALNPETADLAKTIIRYAQRSIRRWGVITITDIAAQITERMLMHVKLDFVTKILQLHEDFQWLDEASGWFWLRSVTENRLLKRIEKMLSVARQIDISELRAGISRDRRMKGFAPPKRVLLELCRQLPGYQVKNNSVVANSSLAWEGILDGFEKKIVRVLKDYGPLLQREEFEETCVSLGIKRSTFYAYLSHSPVIAKYASGVYGLRGIEVPPGAIESLISKRQPSRVLEDYGWTSDGKIWLIYKLSKSMILTGVIGIPTSMKRFVKGKFKLRTADNSSVGALVSKEGSAWGLSPFFGRRGGDPGDYLLLIFDLASREAVVDIGDDSMLDDFQFAGKESLDSSL